MARAADLLGEVPSLTQAHGRLMWIRPGHALAVGFRRHLHQAPMA